MFPFHQPKPAFAAAAQLFPFQFGQPNPLGLFLPASWPKEVPTLASFARNEFAAAKALCNVHHKELMAVVENHVIPAFGHKRLDSITRPEIERWLKGLTGRYRPSTANRYFAVLKSLFNLAVQERVLDWSPCQGLKRPRVVKGDTAGLMGRDAARLLKALLGSDDVQALAALLAVLTGARKMEVLSAQWANIDWERGVLMVPAPKSRNEPRAIYLSGAAKELLRALHGRTGHSRWLFPSPHKGRGHRADTYYWWDRFRRGLGLPGLRFHALRHYCATTMSRSNVQVELAQKLLGHTSIKTTISYYALDDEALSAAMERTDRAMLRQAKR